MFLKTDDSDKFKTMKFQVILVSLMLTSLQVYSQTCPNGQRWVKGHYRRAYVRADGTSVSSTHVKNHCRTSKLDFKYWQNSFKDGMPASWPHKSESFKKWTAEEKERVLEALENLPEILLKVSNISFHRSNKSRDLNNPATSADGIVVLYDTSFTNSSGLERIIAHELSHQLYNDLSPAEKKDYNYATNWFPMDPEGSRYISRKEGFVQDDGRVGPEEDYANNIEFYLFKPDTLKNQTPQAYRWIKNKYGDKFKLGKGDK